MRNAPGRTFMSAIVEAVSLVLLAGSPLAAQCQPRFSLSLYNDPTVSADFSTVYDNFNAVDDSALCSCTHTNYQATVYISSPGGGEVSSSEFGMESYGVMSTNGQLGSYGVWGVLLLNCSCVGPIGGSTGGKTPVTGAAGCSISFSPGQFTAKCDGSQNNSIYNITFTPVTAQNCFVSSPSCSASAASGASIDMGSDPTCSAVAGAIYGHVYYYTGFNPPPPSHTNEGSINITNNFTLNSTSVSSPNSVSVICQ